MHIYNTTLAATYGVRDFYTNQSRNGEKIEFKFQGQNGLFSAEIMQIPGSFCSLKFLRINLESGTTEDYSFIKKFCHELHDQRLSPIKEIFAKTMRTKNGNMDGYSEKFIPFKV